MKDCNTRHMLTLMSENERQSQADVVIDDKLQGTVITYSRCGGFVNNHADEESCSRPSRSSDGQVKSTKSLHFIYPEVQIKCICVQYATYNSLGGAARHEVHQQLPRIEEKEKKTSENNLTM